MPLPEKLLNAPTLNMGLGIYFTAFNHLSTCRVSGFTLGMITYFMCIDYCDENGIYGEQREDFVTIMLKMDEAYLKYMSEKKPKKKGDNNGKPE